MILLYPKQKTQWNPHNLSELPSKYGGSSGYKVIGVAQNGIDLYVAFTNALKDQVWIEKTTTLNPHANHLVFEMLQRIDDNKEFVMIHQFFIKEGLLDGIKKE